MTTLAGITDKLAADRERVMAWAKIPHALISQFSLLIEFFIGKVPVKEHELKLYETARVMSGLFLNFTFITMRGPNKTYET